MTPGREGASGWLVVPRPNPMARARVVCVPHAGAGPSPYRPWTRYLSTDMELRIVAPPGREHRYGEAAVSTLEEYVTAVALALTEGPAMPLVVFGHSMGAVIAYELTLRLAESGRPPQHLFLSGRSPPDDLPAAEPIHELPDGELIETVRSRYGGFPVELENHPELLRHALAALRDDLRLLERFRSRYPAALPCPTTVFFGRRDEGHPEGVVRRWAEVGPVEFVGFDGGHFFVLERAAEVAGHVSNVTEAAISLRDRETRG